jgi:hypothetical protein
MIDIVTVVFDEEIATLQSQAQSIARYCNDLDITHIHVIVNDSIDIDKKIDPRWWQHLESKVTVTNRNCFSNEFGGNGWVDQQLLKLLAAAKSSSKWSLILDAKTIFVQDISNQQLIVDQQAQTGSIDVFSVFEPSKRIVEETFGITFDQQIGPGGVPFLIYNSLARDLISHIEHQYSTTFVRWFLEKGCVTEFMLYGGYVQYRGMREQLYSSRSAIFPCNICHSEVARFDDKLAEAVHSQTVSIHRNAWRQLTAIQQQQYKTFLLERGIVYQ